MSDLGIPGVLDLVGIFVFAVSGALAAVQKRLDVVGMVVLAEITALGGGILRDLVIGAVPPVAFTSVSYVVVPLLASALVFFWHPHFTRIMPAVMLFDAAGLGLFCVTGAIKALDYHLSPLHAVLLGVITAVGGGILRDMMSGQIPSVLYDRQLYALPALVGATVATALWQQPQLHGVFVSAGSALLAFGLRVAAMRWNWRTPRARGVGD
ncbi:trimeric intracellular cation channel family protein [Actinomadura logoneensis]|uniref:trimeric intracellular cation channel family protein n=1 Tax=Actinomadura logoneensis TaxID=2293572 RepID=UPI001F437BBC|nr:trimeric intracellular cation channel family protein [Actinomadura logoneensis]